MKVRELRNLLNRAAAALETMSPQGDLSRADLDALIEDLTTESRAIEARLDNRPLRARRRSRMLARLAR